MESESISRILCSGYRAAAISLGATLPSASCGQPGSRGAGHPCSLALSSGPSLGSGQRARARFPIRPCSERGLDGRRVAATPVGSYSTISPLPGPVGRSYGLMSRATCPAFAACAAPGGLFLCHFPSGFPAWHFASALPCGVRTFLTGRNRCGCPTHSPPGIIPQQKWEVEGRKW